MFTPASLFCCGCSVRFGVGCIAFFHLVACCFYVASACTNLIFKVSFFSSSWSPGAQLFYAAFSLIGIPTTMAALFGVAYRKEINIRLYLFYLAASFLIDLAGLAYIVLVEDPCTSVKYVLDSVADHSRTTYSGQAFMCGAFRIASYFVVTAVVIVEVYCLFIVWSFCEDVHSGNNGPALSELIASKDAIIKRNIRPPDGPYASIVGFAHSKVPGPYPSAYGAIPTAGMPQQSSIFGGTQHETNYPPRQDLL